MTIPKRSEGNREPVAWRSLHIYHYAQQDGLLVDGISSVLQRRRAAGEVDQAFYLRYWKGGPHIRLRLRAAERIDETSRQVHAELAAYVSAHPSRLRLDPDQYQTGAGHLAGHEGVSAGTELVPDNTVRPEPYEPEYGKYGGPLGVEIAEQLFDSSTRLALGAVSLTRHHPERRLGIAFSSLLLATRAAGYGPQELMEFLRYYSGFWASYAPDEVRAAWPARLAEQRRALVATTATALTGGPARGSLGAWSDAVSAAVAAVREKEEEVLGAVSLLGAAAPMNARRNSLLLNYVHTHNNRLGILPVEEAYLGFLAFEALREYAGQKTGEPMG